MIGHDLGAASSCFPFCEKDVIKVTIIIRLYYMYLYNHVYDYLQRYFGHSESMLWITSRAYLLQLFPWVNNEWLHSCMHRTSCFRSPEGFHRQRSTADCNHQCCPNCPRNAGWMINVCHIYLSEYIISRQRLGYDILDSSRPNELSQAMYVKTVKWNIDVSPSQHFSRALIQSKQLSRYLTLQYLASI